MVTRRDWWIGVGAVVLALLVHATVPRYEWRVAGTPALLAIRIDRWTGSAEMGGFTDRPVALRSRWEPLPEAREPQTAQTGDAAATNPGDRFVLRGPPPPPRELLELQDSPLGLIAGGVFVVAPVGGLGFYAGKRRP